MRNFTISQLIRLMMLMAMLGAGCERSSSDFMPLGGESLLGSENAAPRVVATSPVDGDSGVPVDTLISVTFSEAMYTSGITSYTFILAEGLSVDVTTTDERTFTLSPSARLAYETTYTLSVPGQVQDASGKEMGEDYTWSFTTETSPDTTAPRVVSTLPADEERCVSVDTVISVTFSEALDASAVTQDTFVLDNGVTVSVKVDGPTVTLQPSVPLEYETSYTLTVPGEIKDLFGNPMGEDFSWTFSTEYDLGRVIDMVPGAGPEQIFAVDEDRLYEINPLTEQIVRRVSLPLNWAVTPTALGYDPEQGKVYITGENPFLIGAGRFLAVYDLASASFEPPINYSEFSDFENFFIIGGNDLEIVPAKDRMFVLYTQSDGPFSQSQSLSILNSNTDKIIKEFAIQGTSLYYEGQAQRLFTIEASAGRSLLHRYSIEHDTLELLESRTFEPEISAACLLDGQGWMILAVEGALHCVDTQDLSSDYGVDTGEFFTIIHSNPTHDCLFGVSGEQLIVLSKTGLETISSQRFPFADRYAKLTTNSDGSVVCGFSYDASSDKRFGLYFFAGMGE